MTHEQLVEKVARAICDDDHKGGDFGMMGIDAWEAPRGREVYIARARAAIAAIYEAMREPTPDQLTTAGTMAGWNEAAHREADDCHVEWWQAMLEASPLKDERR